MGKEKKNPTRIYSYKATESHLVREVSSLLDTGTPSQICQLKEGEDEVTPPATSAAAEGTTPAPGQRQERSWPPGTGTPQPLELNFPPEVHVIIVIKQRGTHFGEQSTFLWRCYHVPTVFQHADSKGTPKRSFSIAQQIGKPLKRKKKTQKSKPDPWRTTRTSRPCWGVLRGQRQKTHAALQNSPGEATKRSAAAEIGVCVSSKRILPAFLAGRLHFHTRADALYGVSPAASLIPPRSGGGRRWHPPSALSADF